MIKTPTFEHIHIIPKLDSRDDLSVTGTIHIIAGWAEEAGIPYSIENTDMDLPRNVKTRILFVAVGGDGTMLYAMKESLGYGMSSVVGINEGHLGFLVEDFTSRFQLENFFDDIYDSSDVLDERMVLLSNIAIGPHVKGHMAVNEFLFSTGTHNAPFNYKILINDIIVAEQFGSGVLVATSTGSTAMSLSAGGSIVSPSTNIIQIVPLMAHSLSARPIITTGRDTISIETTANERNSDFELRADGRVVWENIPSTNETYRFNILKYPKQVYIHRPKGWNFFDVLTKKMRW